MIWFLLSALVVVAGFAQHYRSQRNDLAAWIFYASRIINKKEKSPDEIVRALKNISVPTEE